MLPAPLSADGSDGCARVTADAAGPARAFLGSGYQFGKFASEWNLVVSFWYGGGVFVRVRV